MSASLFDIGGSWEKPNGKFIGSSVQRFTTLSEGDKVYLYNSEKETITEGFVKKPKYQYKGYWIVKINNGQKDINLRMNNSEIDLINLYYTEKGYVCADYDALFKYVSDEYVLKIEHHRNNLKYFSEKLAKLYENKNDNE